jgi:YD repeat-containing protein
MRWFVLLLFLLLVFPSVSALDAYKPYLHKPAIPDNPGVRLFGQYNTLLFSGAATYAYPIEVPPGTHGLQPTIMLSYNSQAALQRPGVVGSGWALNQNYIYRDVNGTPSDASDDKFLFVFENNLYELIYNPQDRQWHTEVDYHFRIQNITSTLNTGKTAWLLTTTDGTQYRFGTNPDAEVFSNQARGYAVRWNQDQVTDTFGNTISYTYTKDPNIEDAGTSYLASIQYDTDKTRTVTFTYETTPRPDLRASFEQGNKISETRRLTDITVAANGALVRRYHLTYANLGPSLSAPVQITRVGSDNTSVLHTIRLSYNTPTPGYTNATGWTSPVPLSNITGADFGVRLLDVNNDGFAEIIQGRAATGEKKLWLNNHDAWALSNWTLPVYIVDSAGNDSGVRFADINNDGLVDLLVAKAGSAQVWLNNGSGWAISSWTIPVDFVDGAGVDQGVQLADINGDGRTDILRSKAGVPNQVYTNNGAAWTNQTGAWSIPVAFADTKDTGARLVDLNGDGLPDIVQAISNGTTTRRVWLNNGAGWTQADWIVPVDFTNNTFPDTGVRLLDIDGDGLPDLVQNLNNGTIAINTWLNNGTGWQLNNSWQAPAALSYNGTNTGRRLADINGDGSADLIISDTQTATWTRNTTTPYLLSGITNEYGGITTITYSFSTQYNNTGEDGVFALGFPIAVVSRITKNNTITGLQGVLGSYTYSYAGGKYNTTKREFRGFSTTTEVQPGALLKHGFYQDGPRRGKEYNTTIASTNGTLYASTLRDYNVTYLYGIYNVSLRSATTSAFDGGRVPRTTSTTYVYDWFGNPLTIIEQGDVAITGDERTTNYVYAYSKEYWILNHPARITITDASGTKAKETTNYYDDRGYTGMGSRGALTRTENWNNQGNNTIAQFEYDNYGNVIRSTDSAGSTTQYSYDPTHTYQVMTINALGHIAQTAYDPGTGNLLWTQKNGITTSYAYDAHGRITDEIQPYDAPTLPTKHYDYALNGSVPSRVTISLRTTANNTMQSSYFYDGFANLIQLTVARDADQAVKNLYYDAAGRLVAEDNPYLAPQAIGLTAPLGGPQTNYTYDPLDRVIVVRNPDGTNKTTTFDRANITDSDENGHKHTYTTDALGRITTVYEENTDPLLGNITDTYATRYSYDANDNLVTITDNAGNVFGFAYDSLSHKRGMNDPDMGTWHYEYDNRGNLVGQTDARGEHITLTYDALNRILVKTASNTSETFAYDTQYQGTLANITMGDITIAYTYDERLRPTVITQTIDGTPFTTSYVYDSQNRIISEQGLSALDYLYDRQGKVRSIPGYINYASFDAYGSLSSRTYANGLVASYTYDEKTHRLSSIAIPGVQNLSYSYDSVGNIKTINDLQTGKNTMLTYDGLDRLITATIGYDQYEYHYNPLGNIMSIVENNQTKRFVYAGLAHAPSAIIEGGNGADVYHISELAKSKNRTIEFLLLNDQHTTTTDVNVSVEFGDGQHFAATNMSVNSSVLFLGQNNYTDGGDYQINVTSTTPNGVDYEIKRSKFGVRALGIALLGTNITQRTFEFDFGSDVAEPLPNVTWACTGANSTIPITLCGVMFDFLRVNYTSPGPKTFSCTVSGPDGNDTASTAITIDGLEIASFDTLSTNVSRRVIGFNAKNNYYPLTANISVAGENTAFSTIANLTSGEQVLVFAEVNNTLGDSKGITVNLTAPGDTQQYTNLYSIKGASIDSYTRVDLTNSTKVLLYGVRNTWNNGTVAWALSDPGMAGTATLASGDSVLLFIATNYTQGDKTPTLSATSAGYNTTISDQFTVKPLSLNLLTLTDGPASVSELAVMNTAGDAQNVTWTYNTGTQNLTGTASVDGSLLVLIQANYTSMGVYKTTATANTSTAMDSKTGVVIA